MKNKIELNILVFILMESFTLLFFSKISVLNIIIGTLFGLLLVILSKKIQIIRKIYLILIIPFTIISFYKIVLFIKDVFLNNHPIFIIGFSFLFTAFYLINKGYHNFIKIVEICSYFILIIKLISFILSISLIDINNINNISFGINIDFIYYGLFIFIIYQLFNQLFDYNIKKKILIYSLINSSLIIILPNFILGNTLFTIYKYPYVSYLQGIKYFDFIERMEGLLSFEYLYSFIIMFSFCLLIVTKPIKKSH